MKTTRVCLIGGSGFVGRHLTYRLASAGIHCRIVTRRPHRHMALRTANGCELVEADIRRVDALARQFDGCDAVINLVGILNESGRNRFQSLHVDLTENVVNACRQAGVPRYLHMSALNADASKGGSLYLRSKGEGENRAHTLGKPKVAVTSFRPSVIFGPDDSFINRFDSLLSLPGPLPLACADARFAPVYVGDVVEAFYRALDDAATYDQHYELCGPEEYSLRGIVDYILTVRQRSKWIINLPDSLARLQAGLLQFAPGKPFTPDNYRSLQTPSVCRDNGLARLGIEATSMDAIVPQYLVGDSAKGRFSRLRSGR